MKELLNKLLTFDCVEMVGSDVYVNDFEGFDEDWGEILNEIPDEVYEIVTELENVYGMRIYFTSEDI